MKIQWSVLITVLLTMAVARASEILDLASSDFLTESVVFEDNVWATAINVYRMDLTPNAGEEIIVTTTDKIIFLDRSCQEIRGLNLKELRFNTIEPLYFDTKGSYGFLGYRYGKGVWLLDREANEIWSQTGTGDSGLHPRGGCYGDNDGDGMPEVVVFYEYRDGIHLLNGDGSTRWKHPVYALGHLEITDFNRDGKAEIL